MRARCSGLEPNGALHGARIAGVPVLGPLSAVQDKAVRGAATHLVIALPSLRGSGRKRVFELAAQTGLPVLTVPSSEELQAGTQVNRIRDIEPEDLLGREPVQLDEAGIDACLRSNRGPRQHRQRAVPPGQVARYGPARLVLYELSEFNLAES